ncbi:MULTISPECIES: hypothetical protein [Micromonospora]|uniref:Uncharacterized protein n=1 Tax=Micromonospora tulbaghiae TaxID=479978 RepID=A0ABY0KVR1_9ACTN|nr:MULTISPECIES: hypothetical protein [Micromonospora]SCF01318.1 hypothetical protein GA0070562_5132 [Micromonospora tulbaghiae]
MSEVDLIVTALAAGASAGVSATASSAVQDAYAALKDRLRELFADRPEAQGKLYADKTLPGQWQELLGADLVASEAASDPAVLAAARDLLREAPAGTTVHVAGNIYGQQIGDRTHQRNEFH